MRTLLTSLGATLSQQEENEGLIVECAWSLSLVIHQQHSIASWSEEVV